MTLVLALVVYWTWMVDEVDTNCVIIIQMMMRIVFDSVVEVIVLFSVVVVDNRFLLILINY